MAPQWTWRGFGPTILGWIWGVLILSSILTFIWLSIFNLKNKKLKCFLQQAIFFISLILLFVFTWCYRAGIPLSKIQEVF